MGDVAERSARAAREIFARLLVVHSISPQVETFSGVTALPAFQPKCRPSRWISSSSPAFRNDTDPKSSFHVQTHAHP